MSLVTTDFILKNARRKRIGVGAFEVWNMESVQAVVRTAENLNQPVILQIGPFEADYAGLEDISRIAIYYAVNADVPVSVHLDHGESFERTIRCIHAGFTSVMYDASYMSYEENVKITTEVVKIAHACGVSVEGEIGRIGGEEAGINVTAEDTHLTDPDQALEYVQRTGIDNLAVAIGTVHGFYRGKPNIRLELLEKIADKVDIPLVLHGGSGLPEDIISKSIRIGIAKINICTEYVKAFSDSFMEELQKPEFRYNVPGVFSYPRQKAAEVVERKIKLFAAIG